LIILSMYSLIRPFRVTSKQSRKGLGKIIVKNEDRFGIKWCKRGRNLNVLKLVDMNILIDFLSIAERRAKLK